MDLGGTKLATALFSEDGELLSKESIALGSKTGDEVGKLILNQAQKFLSMREVSGIGISVPGISRHRTGTVWAPNINGWDNYPLQEVVKQVSDKVSVTIESDRVCSILGEQWKGNARGCKDVIFVAVGTGIGAGILVDGHILRGSNDIAGAIGWMALPKPFEDKYLSCGCFEFYASGAGIVKFAKELLLNNAISSKLRTYSDEDLLTRHVFEAFEEGDHLAGFIIRECISYWGMASANLVSIFNPEKIIFGGGVFGPASKFIHEIKAEAIKWAQPISITQVSFEKSFLEGEAAVYGAGFLALNNYITS
jgi:glucokinase